MTSSKKQFLNVPYGAYYNEPIPQENVDLTHVERGSRSGELLRRYWQPIAMSSQVRELPLRARIFGEDLVVFRTTAGQVGILDLHCSHRGSSLEFGRREETGIRCCYHGWLYAVDGTILETPGNPPGTDLHKRLCHGAYPAREYKGLVFGYFGPPEERPEFPVYDSFEFDGDELVPYSLHYPCNWLQVHENVMDPVHTVFLHTQISYSHFADVWGELPLMEFVETPTGMIYVTTRRWKNNVWVRSNDIILPNLAQVGHIWEDGQRDLKAFARVGITRWTMPVDNESCRLIGWRHFHPDVDPIGIGKRDDCGLESVDFVGQTGERPYQERQRVPGDFDAQVSQRPIARHALEHLTYCDKGVVMLRRLLRRELEKLDDGDSVTRSPHRSNGVIPTYCHDTVLEMPPLDTEDDATLLAEVSREVTRIVVEGSHHTADHRAEVVRRKIHGYVRARTVEH